MEKWTQDESIAFECACEAISHLMAIRSHQIDEEENSPAPDTARVEQLYADRLRLGLERQSLHVDCHREIARIRAEYGALIRAWSAQDQAVAA